VNTRCTYLERVHGCDCHKCLCDDAFWSTTQDGNNATTMPDTTSEVVLPTTTPMDDKCTGVETSVVGGGYSNSAMQKYAVISGGRGNLATQEFSTSSGGLRNSVRSNYAHIGGGFQNIAAGRFMSIVGGRQNSASGRHSVLLGSAAAIRTTNPNMDHVLLMNFRQLAGMPVPSAVEMENTISLQSDALYFNTVDLNALAVSARRLSESQQQIDDVVQRLDAMKVNLRENLAELRAVSQRAESR
jgi:hypothetical protein